MEIITTYKILFSKRCTMLLRNRTIIVYSIFLDLLYSHVRLTHISLTKQYRKNYQIFYPNLSKYTWFISFILTKK